MSLNDKKIVVKKVKMKLKQLVRKLQLGIGLRGNFSDMNSNVLVPVKKFQFQELGNENAQFRDGANGLILKNSFLRPHNGLKMYLTGETG